MRIGLIDVDEEKKMRIKEIEGFDGRYKRKYAGGYKWQKLD